MTDVEKRDVVKSIVAKSGIRYDLDIDKKESSKVEKHYENIMGSDSFFVLSSKVNLNDSECSRKELYVIVDEKYAFVQLTNFYEENGMLLKRLDEIVRYKKIDNKVLIEKAELDQETGIVEVHSIEEMKKVDSNFDDSMVKREIIEVDDDFKFTTGFDEINVDMGDYTNLKYNLISKYIEFSLETRNAV